MPHLRLTMSYLACMPVFMSAGTSLANEYYVSASDGSDAFPGDRERPFRTIQKSTGRNGTGKRVLNPQGNLPRRSESAAIHASGSGHVLTSNTIFRAARSGIVHRKSHGLLIAFNDINYCGLPTMDLVATYCYQTDGRGTVIHHNAVWNTDAIGIQTNLDATNHEIFDNAIWNVDQAMGGGGGNEQLVNQKVTNNLSNSGAWFGTDCRGNLALSEPGFMDAPGGDFRLRSDSPARDDYDATANFINGGFEAGVSGWTGAVSAYLRFKLVDETGESYPGTTIPCGSGEWKKISFSQTLNWRGTMKEAVFELMTTDADKALSDLFVDDCQLLAPPALTPKVGGVLIPGITDDVLDGKPDAGAYEFGGAQADWKVGSSVLVVDPDISEMESGQPRPDQFRLRPVSPNPFHSTTSIEFDLPRVR
jgi:hypothetical protein